MANNVLRRRFTFEKPEMIHYFTNRYINILVNYR